MPPAAPPNGAGEPVSRPAQHWTGAASSDKLATGQVEFRMIVRRARPAPSRQPPAICASTRRTVWMLKADRCLTAVRAPAAARTHRVDAQDLGQAGGRCAPGGVRQVAKVAGRDLLHAALLAGLQLLDDEAVIRRLGKVGARLAPGRRPGPAPACGCRGGACMPGPALKKGLRAVSGQGLQAGLACPSQLSGGRGAAGSTLSASSRGRQIALDSALVPSAACHGQTAGAPGQTGDKGGLAALAAPPAQLCKLGRPPCGHLRTHARSGCHACRQVRSHRAAGCTCQPQRTRSCRICAQSVPGLAVTCGRASMQLWVEPGCQNPAASQPWLAWILARAQGRPAASSCTTCSKCRGSLASSARHSGAMWPRCCAVRGSSDADDLWDRAVST